MKKEYYLDGIVWKKKRKIKRLKE